MGIIFSNHADAKAAKAIGVITAMYGIGVVKTWGILSSILLITAGIVLFRHDAQTVNGIRGILRNILFFVLLLASVAAGPVSG